MAIHGRTKEDVFNFLQETPTAVIATSLRDEPRASTVYFVVDEEFNFYFITRRNTSKYLNGELNPKVAIVVGTGPEHISVQAHGQLDMIVNEDEKTRVKQLIRGKQALKNTGVWPIDELKDFKGEEDIVYKIVPFELVYFNLDSAKHPFTIGDEYIKII